MTWRDRGLGETITANANAPAASTQWGI